MYKKLVFIAIALISVVKLNAQDSINLSGRWDIFIDYDNKYTGNTLPDKWNDSIILPNTLDAAQKSRKQVPSDIQRLSRKYAFEGRAYYHKRINISDSQSSKRLELELERTKPTKLWIDGKLIGSNSIISSSQKYILPSTLSKGYHDITIMVDNGKDCGLPQNIISSHAWSADTQTNWNGILGTMRIIVKNNISFDNVRVYPSFAEKKITVKGKINNLSNSTNCIIKISGITDYSKSIKVNQGINDFEISFNVNKDYKWNEFTPHLIKFQLALYNNSKLKEREDLSTALRDISVIGKGFALNGDRIFLRGKHDACVFPLTGYPPMHKDEWIKYFTTLRNYGFNHVRFHSWCPPEACFEAADEIGFYLQPELPMWGEIPDSLNTPLCEFLISEAKGIFDAYGNHPSFMFFSSGNELWGNVETMKNMVKCFREYDLRHLYALGSNYHLGWKGSQDTEDFLVTCRVGGNDDANFKPHVRASFSFADAIDGGLLNATYPNTVMDFDSGVSFAFHPVISHETGQYQFYINPAEFSKYTGVLTPYNLKHYYSQLSTKFGDKKLSQFFKANGALSAACYKADIEMLLRTDSLAGFQMLDIQDFPGQGTALIGILDAFMDNKGIISSKDFKKFNNDIVPLWCADSYTFHSGEPITGEIKIFNYSNKPLNNCKIALSIIDKNSGETLFTETRNITQVSSGKLSGIGNFSINIPLENNSKQYILSIAIPGTDICNSYPLWIYSNHTTSSKPNIYSEPSDEMFTLLNNGGCAILMPTKSAFPKQTIDGLFTPDYWNYSMFKSISQNAKKPISPGSLGLLIDDKHPIFKNFPTESHSDWQWWSIVKSSCPIICDSIYNNVDMIVETIDNIERGYCLGLIFECKVGNGKLLVCMSDLQTAATKHKESAALLFAIKEYVSSSKFNPSKQISEIEIKKLFSTNYINNIKGVKNISYED